MIALDVDDHHLHVLRMLAGAHGQSLEEYLTTLIRQHCKHLTSDADRGLAFATVEFLNYESIPQLTAELLNNTLLGFDLIRGTSDENNL